MALDKIDSLDAYLGKFAGDLLARVKRDFPPYPSEKISSLARPLYDAQELKGASPTVGVLKRFAAPAAPATGAYRLENVHSNPRSRPEAGTWPSSFKNRI